MHLRKKGLIVRIKYRDFELSFHIIYAQICEDLMNQNQSIVYALFKQDDKLRNEYHIS